VLGKIDLRGKLSVFGNAKRVEFDLIRDSLGSKDDLFRPSITLLLWRSIRLNHAFPITVCVM
jgi:hypothetical protein